MTDIEERFWSKVRIGDGCWVWTAGLIKGGYGRFGVGRGRFNAHRVAWEFQNGPIPAGLFACHKCDERRCVRPSHLFLGTHDDNMRDMVAKGRARPMKRRGELNPRAKLTRDAVVEMRRRHRAGATIASLAREFGVAGSTASMAIRGHRWGGDEG